MMKPEYKHELTDTVPPNFPKALLDDVREAADDRVIIDREDNVVRVAAVDNDAVRWLLGWLDDRPEDGAQGLADTIESSFGITVQRTV